MEHDRATAEVAFKLALISTNPTVQRVLDHLMVVTKLAHGEQIAQWVKQKDLSMAARDKLLASGKIDGYGLMEFRPPCSRHDDTTDDDSARVKNVWLYAMARLNPELAAQESRAIARLHDHKGLLYVATYSMVGERALDALKFAWSEIAIEDRQHVFMAGVDTDEWARVWESRRFKSKWTGKLPTTA